ncbi:unnamed protein product [Nezara viridula]|uniref:Uncharacterized protein n=1 Tax=Nezara viridula TaxID=85310 RepID=A0A9P0ECY3_NEZVI|nr:unnamed protein product [Nezara viridula]
MRYPSVVNSYTNSRSRTNTYVYGMRPADWIQYREHRKASWWIGSGRNRQKMTEPAEASMVRDDEETAEGAPGRGARKKTKCSPIKRHATASGMHRM